MYNVSSLNFKIINDAKLGGGESLGSSIASENAEVSLARRQNKVLQTTHPPRTLILVTIHGREDPCGNSWVYISGSNNPIEGRSPKEFTEENRSTLAHPKATRLSAERHSQS